MSEAPFSLPVQRNYGGAKHELKINQIENIINRLSIAYISQKLESYSYCKKYVSIGRGVCDSRNPPVPLSKRGNATRMELHELTNSDNDA